MLAQVQTGVARGVDAVPVQTEVHISSGLPSFTVVGLAHGSVREGRERVGAALRCAGYGVPNRRITVNLAPADVRKEGTAFDLPIAIGVLSAAGLVPPETLRGHAFLGELGLDGALRAVAGVLPIAATVHEAGATTLVVPRGNAAEAALVEGLTVVPASSIAEVVDHLTGECTLAPQAGPLRLGRGPTPSDAPRPDLADVRGQAGAKRALEIAAAGSHDLLLVGPPGAGKTMLARRLPGLLPPLDFDEALEVARVHSVAGRLVGGALVRERPFRAPHHSVSYAGLVGGGTPLRPGEVSLAHHGVLFLDELGEYRRDVLEVLRQPLEERAVRLARAGGAVSFPARFLLVAAMNPCPCGYAGDGTDRCTCDPSRIVRYQGRVSGPLLDRIDLHVHVGAVPLDQISSERTGEPSTVVAARVAAARDVQWRRCRRRGGAPRANGHLGPADLRRWAEPRRDVVRYLRRALDGLGLSARAYHRVVKVARTIADLDGDERVAVRHAAEAVQYRALDRLAV